MNSFKVYQPYTSVAMKKTIYLDGVRGAHLNITIVGEGSSLDHVRALELYDAIGDLMGYNKPVGPPPPQPPKAHPTGPQEYKGSGKHVWEDVVEPYDTNGPVLRLRVPGGWIYSTTHADGGESTVFVPMPATVGYGV